MVALDEHFHHKDKKTRSRADRRRCENRFLFIDHCSLIFKRSADANWNTTAIVGYNSTTGVWAVTQRYVYSLYGTITVLNADWSTPPMGTPPIVQNLYQGMALDAVTGLYYSRNRNYSTTLGTWVSQDPAGYINGANTYQFVVGNPAGNVDPSGFFMGIGGFFHGITNGIGGAIYNLGQLGAPVASYVVNTLTYPGDRLLGLPTNQGLGWGQGSLVVGLIQGSPNFQQKSQAWLKEIVATWSSSDGCKSAHGKIADRKTIPNLSIRNTSQFKLTAYDIIGQLTIGSFVAHAFATGPAQQVCRNGAVVGGASLAIQYDVSDTFHQHLGSWEPGQFNQTIHWAGSQYVPIARKY